MNKWWWLLLGIACWMAVGLATFGSRGDRYRPQAAGPMKVDRIVSMAPSLTEILFALGLCEEIVGVTLFSDYPPAAAEKTKVGTFVQPNIEAIIATRPNLVMTLGSGQQKTLAERLKRIGYNSLAVNIETVRDFFRVVGEIGAATGRQRQACELVGDIEAKLDALAGLVADLPEVKVLWVVQREPFRVAGRDTFVNEMIELAGGVNAIGQTVHKYPPIGAEQVIASSADVIIEPAMGRHDLETQRDGALRHWSRFRNLPAVKNGRIYVMGGDTVSRLGPRLYEGTETIARYLRPHLFED